MRSAFTLIELMVVIGIILVIVGFTVPALNGLSKGNDLSSSGRVFSNLLTVTRSEAISQRRLTQLRIATKWMNAGGTEDTTASYRKYSVWRRPQADDAVQSSDPNDPYIQVSKWETLPTGVVFERDATTYTFPAADDPRYPGIHFLAASLGTTRTGVRVPTGTADVAWIEFNPNGGANYAGTVPARVFVLLTEGFWNGTNIVATQKNHANWLAATVDSLIGRINVIRP